MKKTYHLIILIGLLIVSFVAFNIASSIFLGNYKLDLSKNKIFSLSDDSIEALNSLNSDINFKIYISENLEKDFPKEAQYSKYVLKILEEYKLNSKRNINIDIKNVTPYSANEAEANKLGLQPIKSKNGKHDLYFGMSISDDLGNFATINELNLARKALLENDVTRILSKISSTDDKTIGVISYAMDVMARPHHFNQDKDLPFITELKESYNVKYINPKVPEIPHDVDVLMLINPNGLDLGLVYAVEQFVLRGGNLLVFIDAYSETAKTHAKDALSPLLSEWGINVETNKIVGDSSLAIPSVIKTALENISIQDFPLWIKLNKNNINQDITWLKNIDNIVFRTPTNIIAPKAQVLLKTSSNGGEYSAAKSSDFYNSGLEFLNNYNQSNREYNLAILQEGSYQSIFTESIYARTGLEKLMLPHLYDSISNSKIIVISDVDIISEISLNNNNLWFIVKALDYLGGGDVKSIGAKFYPFDETTIAEKLYQKSFAEYKNEYEALLQDLDSTKGEYDSLMRSISKLEITPSIAVLKDLENLQKNTYIIQKELNYLDYQINKTFDEDKNKIILLNVLFFPVLFLLLVFALNQILFFYKRKYAKRIVNE